MDFEVVIETDQGKYDFHSFDFKVRILFFSSLELSIVGFYVELEWNRPMGLV